MGKRIVIALGGNALGKNLPEQMVAVKHTAKAIVDLIEEGHQVVVAHGNGPQVGMINIAMTTLSREDPTHPMAPMSVCTAMSQGYIGYDLQNSLREELLNRGMHKPVATILTQVEVDPNDPAFQNPTKPIGTFMTEAEAEEMRRRGNAVMEDAGRGWRRCVASPLPKAIVEIGGATEVYACATHGVLSGPANERIADSCIKELTFLNTIPPLEGACSKIKYLDVSPIFADAIQRIYEENSMSVLF